MTALPSYKELKDRLPLRPKSKNFISNNRQVIRSLLNGSDPRLLLVVGPCSIHDPKSALDYAFRLKSLAKKVSSHFFILMRVFCEKPRTVTGWKGYLYDPDLDGSHDMLKGIEWTRELLLDLAEMEIPAATEFLDPLTAYYYEDLISWGSIGARTSSSQPHRQLASGLSIPIGIKNGVAGNISSAINGVICSTYPHIYMGLNELGIPSKIQTNGNPDVHIVLRGGESGPNFDSFSIGDALRRLQQAEIHPRLVVDCSHQNSGKQADKQPAVFHSVLNQIIQGNMSIRGMMLESHINSGHQSLACGAKNLAYGVSLTDDCLDWVTTEQLILQGASYLMQNLSILEEEPAPLYN